MNPLDKIKRGVEKQDWDLVCEGHNAMTGQNLLKPPQRSDKNVLMLEVPYNESTIRLFKQCLRQMIDEFVEFVPEDHVAETCDVSQPVDQLEDDDDVAEPEDDDEENVEFDEVTQTKDGVGHYGNPTVVLTEKPKQNQIQANQKRAEARADHEVCRPPPKMYKVKCTDCETPFESHRRSGKFGQKCPKCLRSTARER